MIGHRHRVQNLLFLRVVHGVKVATVMQPVQECQIIARVDRMLAQENVAAVEAGPEFVGSPLQLLTGNSRAIRDDKSVSVSHLRIGSQEKQGESEPPPTAMMAGMRTADWLAAARKTLSPPEGSQ